MTHDFLAQDKKCIMSLMEDLSPPVLGNEAGTEENCFFVSVLSRFRGLFQLMCQKYLP